MCGSWKRTCNLKEAAGRLIQRGFALGALSYFGRIGKYQSVLVHDAAKGLALACVEVALQRRAEIYATVQSHTEKEMLMKHFNISADHIFSGGDESFADGILLQTNGRGVDIVVSHQTGHMLLSSWDFLATYGRLINIGNSEGVPALQGRANASLIHFNSHTWLRERPSEAKESIDNAIELFRLFEFLFSTPLQLRSTADIAQALKTAPSQCGAAVIQ